MTAIWASLVWVFSTVWRTSAVHRGSHVPHTLAGWDMETCTEEPESQCQHQ